MLTITPVLLRFVTGNSGMKYITKIVRVSCGLIPVSDILDPG